MQKATQNQNGNCLVGGMGGGLGQSHLLYLGG